MKALVINYGVGNLYSISNALRRTGFEVFVEVEPRGDVDLIVFPGVGNFKAVSRYITRYSNILDELRKKGVAFLGICIGMQIMFEYSMEGGVPSKGLGWFKGYVDRIPTKLKLPRIGWDKIKFVENDRCRLFQGLDGKYMYFMHSYMAYTNDADSICFISEYGDAKIPSMVLKERMIGVQFHPEKSHLNGAEFLKVVFNWLRV